MLGKGWRTQHQEKLAKTRAAYFSECWAPVASTAEALAKEADGEVCLSAAGARFVFRCRRSVCFPLQTLGLFSAAGAQFVRVSAII